MVPLPLSTIDAASGALGVERVELNHQALADAWSRDLAARAAAGHLAERSAVAYVKNADRWLRWINAQKIARPTPADVLAYVAALRESGLKAASVNAYLDAIRSLYRWAETQNLYPAIARSISGLKVRKDEPLACLDRKAIGDLLNHIRGNHVARLRNRALIHVLFATGLRLVSLTGANLSDFDAATASLSYQGKGDSEKARRAYLSASAAKALSEYITARRIAWQGRLSPFAPLFAVAGNRADGERLSDRSIRRIITTLMERAGHVLRDDTGKITRPRVLSAHSIRRSAITAAYEAKGLDAAQTLAGHADPKTTLRAYARVQKGRILKELAGALDLETL